jgi:hypothetical protein
MINQLTSSTWNGWQVGVVEFHLLMSAAETLQLNSLDDWYNVTIDHFINYGGYGLLQVQHQPHHHFLL